MTWCGQFQTKNENWAIPHYDDINPDFQEREDILVVVPQKWSKSDRQILISYVQTYEEILYLTYRVYKSDRGFL